MTSRVDDKSTAPVTSKEEPKVAAPVTSRVESMSTAPATDKLEPKVAAPVAPNVPPIVTFPDVLILTNSAVPAVTVNASTETLPPVILTSSESCDAILPRTLILLAPVSVTYADDNSLKSVCRAPTPFVFSESIAPCKSALNASILASRGVFNSIH